MSDHSLADVEHLDVGNGKGSLGREVAICACGWRTDPEPERQAALDRLTDHCRSRGGAAMG